MNYTLFDLFLNAYNGNSFAQLQIVQRFQPLLKKYAALLKYEDAYSDLQLYLLELLHSGKLTKLQRKDDGTLVKYIESSIRHQYISLNSRKNAVDILRSAATLTASATPTKMNTARAATNGKVFLQKRRQRTERSRSNMNWQLAHS